MSPSQTEVDPITAQSISCADTLKSVAVCMLFHLEQLDSLKDARQSGTVLNTEIRQISDHATRILELLEGSLVGCSQVCNKDMLTRLQHPAMFPQQVYTAQTLFPRISAICMKKIPLRVVFGIAWVIGFLFGALSMYDVVTSWWVGWIIAVGMLPTMLFIFSCFNTSLVMKLIFSFQSTVVFYNAMGLVVAYTTLWRYFPLKITAALLTTPSFLGSGFLDAFPEIDRINMSRIFFFLNMIGLTVFLAAVMFSLADLDDVKILLFNRWNFVLSAIATGSISNLYLFGRKNLVRSVLRPGTLAVITDKVVSVKVEKGLIPLVSAVHALALGSVKKSILKKITQKREAKVFPMESQEVSRSGCSPIDDTLSSLGDMKQQLAAVAPVCEDLLLKIQSLLSEPSGDSDRLQLDSGELSCALVLNFQSALETVSLCARYCSQKDLVRIHFPARAPVVVSTSNS